MVKNSTETTNSEFYDFIIVGAGPGGLTAGIVSTKMGLKCLILEKGKVPGPKPRGETIHDYPLINDIMGKGFIKSISKHETIDRIFHSPKNVFQSNIIAQEISYVFDWRDFIDRLVKISNDLNVEIRCSSEVISPIIREEMCIGVNYKDKEGIIREAYGNAIFACDGFESVIGNYFKIDYSRINNSMIKCLVSNANINIAVNSALELFLVASGELKFAPEFPPCALFMFPRGGKEIEIGLMTFTTAAIELDSVSIPDNEELLRVWSEIKIKYPGFSEFLKGGIIEHEEVTGIGSAKLVENFIPYPGVVLIGDSAGFVESSGSSGLHSSMAMAEFFAKSIGNELNSVPENITELIKSNKTFWTDEKRRIITRTFKKTAIYKRISKTYKLFNGFIINIFKNMRTAENVNEKWELISSILQKAKS